MHLLFALQVQKLHGYITFALDLISQTQTTEPVVDLLVAVNANLPFTLHLLVWHHHLDSTSRYLRDALVFRSVVQMRISSVQLGIRSKQEK